MFAGTNSIHSTPIVLRQCGFCGADIVKTFDARRDDRRFCNKKCQMNSWYWANHDYQNRYRRARYHNGKNGE